MIVLIFCLVIMCTSGLEVPSLQESHGNETCSWGRWSRCLPGPEGASSHRWRLRRCLSQQDGPAMPMHGHLQETAACAFSPAISARFLATLSPGLTLVQPWGPSQVVTFTCRCHRPLPNEHILFTMHVVTRGDKHELVHQQWTTCPGRTSVKVRVDDAVLAVTCTLQKPSGDIIASLNAPCRTGLAPQIQVAQEKVRLVTGMGVNLECRLLNEAEGVVFLWVRKDGQPLPVGHKYSHKKQPVNKLMLNNLKAADCGEYMCHVQNSLGSSVASAMLLLHPTLTLLPSGEVMVNIHQPVSFECQAVGFPRPKVSWYRMLEKDNLILVHNQKKTSRYENNHMVYITTMNIDSPKKIDEGEYACFASNIYKSTKENIKLVVSSGDSAISDENMSEYSSKTGGSSKVCSGIICSASSIANSHSTTLEDVDDTTENTSTQKYEDVTSEESHSTTVSSSKSVYSSSGNFFMSTEESSKESNSKEEPSSETTTEITTELTTSVITTSETKSTEISDMSSTDSPNDNSIQWATVTTSDESIITDSSEGCLAGRILCTNRECFALEEFCDGKEDCQDGSDEWQCLRLNNTYPCRDDEYLCRRKDKICIAEQLVSDKDQHLSHICSQFTESENLFLG